MKKNTTISRHVLITVLYMALCLIVVGCRKPNLPVELAYRSSKIGQGYVVAFHNTSNKHLAVRVILTNRTLGAEKDTYIELGPSETKEIGWMEGWKFVSGETVTLRHQDYRSRAEKIP